MLNNQGMGIFILEEKKLVNIENRKSNRDISIELIRSNGYRQYSKGQYEKYSFGKIYVTIGTCTFSVTKFFSGTNTTITRTIRNNEYKSLDNLKKTLEYFEKLIDISL